MQEHGQTVFEFDSLVPEGVGGRPDDAVRVVPAEVYEWLEARCAELSERGGPAWLRAGHRRGRRVIQVTNYVGVIRSPGGYQIEVLPKLGKAMDGGADRARTLLLEMLSCLRDFRHVRTESAKLLAVRMPLLEVFITEFLLSVEQVVKRGLRSSYSLTEGNIQSLRGKLLLSNHLRQNACRADRFYAEFDVFSANRPENRLLRAALQRALELSRSVDNLRLARELEFAFQEVPVTERPELDFQRVRLDRNMSHYASGMSWSKLILSDMSPLTGQGNTAALSLLYPMERVFEAFVAKHLHRQTAGLFRLREQARSEHLVRHQGQKWFQLNPDLVVSKAGRDVAVLDTKWKLLDAGLSNATDKYRLSQSDFYQLLAYGENYLSGSGDLALVFPKTDAFREPLPRFDFPAAAGLRLWVLPFCLESNRLLLPAGFAD
jgi:5-methylcytosine-specific restriction enzyme subunit McrC